MDDEGTKRRPKLPVQQLTILAVARFSEPIATTSVYPYLPQMVRDFGIEQDEVAKWAGITSGVFSIFQSLAAVPWGKVADRWGRKPVLILGLLCTMTCFIIWGMSTSLTMAIIVRAVQGASNGNVGIIRTMVAEMVPEKELQPRAFSIMPLVWSLGSVVGPAFGGFFADPVKQFPGLFGKIEYFKKFPYALPNLIATFFFLISAAIATFFLKETLASKKDKKDWGLLIGKRLSRAFTKHGPETHRRHSFVDGEATAALVPNYVRERRKQADEPEPGFMEIFTRQTVLNMIAYFFLAFHSVAYDQNVTVFLNYEIIEHTPENTKLPFYFSGGFGLESGRIGTIFMIYGVTCGIVQFFVFSPMVTRYGILNCYRVCSLVMPFIYLLTPYTALFSTPAGRLAGLAFVLTLKAFTVIVAFPAVTILLTNCCPSLRILGTLNGFVTMFSGIGRAIGPASTGLAFTWGVEHGYIITAYYFLAFIAVCGAIPVFFVVEGDGPTATAENSDDEGDDSQRSGSVLLSDTYEDAIEDSSGEESEPDAPLMGRSRKRAHSPVKANRQGKGQVVK